MIIFIITSALNSNFGIFDYKTRLDSLIQSANSVRDKSPTSYIILADGGKEPITFNQRQILLKCFDEVIDLSQHSFISFIQNMPEINSFFVKSPCEAYMMYHLCNIIGSNNVERVFKLSGRYTLTNNFNLQTHLSQKEKYVFKSKDCGWVWYNAETGETFPRSQYQYQTRLYSICGTLIDEAANVFESIKNALVRIYSNNSFSIIEDAMFQFFPAKSIYEVEKIGVRGLMADDGREVNE